MRLTSKTVKRSDRILAFVRDFKRGNSTVAELCREHGMPRATAYRILRRVGSLEASKMPLTADQFRLGRPPRNERVTTIALIRKIRQREQKLADDWRGKLNRSRGHPKSARPYLPIEEIRAAANESQFDGSDSTLRRILAEMHICTAGQKLYRRRLHPAKRR